MQKIISWNVASIRARMPTLTRLLTEENPDIVLLQEIKAEESSFPFFDLKLLGYNAIISGQKSYNGVAILTKKEIHHIKTDLLANDPLPQARFIQAELDGFIVISVYVPNGNAPEKNPQDKTKLHYKLEWMEALYQHLTQLINAHQKVILGGDFNVIERDTDVYNPELFRDNALMLPEVRQAYAKITQLPITNTIRLKNPAPNTYSFWDFQMAAWQRNKGMLLDAIFINNELYPLIENATILKTVRGWDKTSDHAPVCLILK